MHWSLRDNKKTSVFLFFRAKRFPRRALKVSEANGTSVGSIKCNTSLAKLIGLRYDMHINFKGVGIMASVNYLKIKFSADAKAMLRHCENDERLQHEHSNKDIDKSKTYLNRQLRSYEDSCSFYDNRIKELDNSSNKNKRKDRVTMFGLNIPVPEHLNRNEYSEWFDKVNSIVSEMYGGDDNANIVGLYQHYDEEHTYIDAETKRERVSRVHEHIYIIPEHDEQLNGKWFSSRANILKLDKAIHEMTVRDYCINFMDGSKKKSKSEVETLKNRSLAAENEILAKQNVKLSQKVYDLDVRGKMLDDRDSVLTMKEQSLASNEFDLDFRKRKFEKNKQDTEQSLKAKEKALEARESDLKAKEKELQDMRSKIALRASKGFEEIDDILSSLDDWPSPDDALVSYTKSLKFHNGSTVYDGFKEKQLQDKRNFFNRSLSVFDSITKDDEQDDNQFS